MDAPDTIDGSAFSDILIQGLKRADLRVAIGMDKKLLVSCILHELLHLTLHPIGDVIRATNGMISKEFYNYLEATYTREDEEVVRRMELSLFPVVWRELKRQGII